MGIRILKVNTDRTFNMPLLDLMHPAVIINKIQIITNIPGGFFMTSMSSAAVMTTGGCILIFCLFFFFASKLKKRKQAEKLWEQNFSSILLNHAAMVVCIWDVQGNLLYFNSHATHITGFFEKELLGNAWREKLFTKDGIEFFQSLLPMAGELEWSCQKEGNIFDKNKNSLHMLWNYKSFYDARKKEFRILAMGIDMTERKSLERTLKKHDHEMEVLYKELFYTNEKLKSTAHVLEESYKIAEAEKNAKNDFLDNLSHEIRTPMYGITIMVQLLEKTSLNSEQKGYLELLKRSALQFSGILHDILDISSIDTEKPALDIQPVCIRKWVHELENLYIGKIKDRGLILDFDLDEKIPETLMCDAHKIKQIITNLMSNALKYTLEGRIDFSIRLQEENDKVVIVHFEVRDTGVGIPEDKLSLIFDCFTQGDSSYTKEFTDIGLGLTISKKLAECMQGTMRVESELGKGSRFSFSIPTEKPMEEKRYCLTRELATEQKQEASASFKVLVVEDDAIARIFLGNLLQSLGYTCLFAENGEEAVEEYQRECFDIILMDIQMPKMDGMTASRMIRVLEAVEGGHIPIIATSAYVLPNEVEKMYLAGVDDTLAKPINASVLLEKIEKWTQRVYT